MERYDACVVTSSATACTPLLPCRMPQRSPTRCTAAARVAVTAIAGTKPRMKPALGPTSASVDMPPANTGRPHAPIATYMTTAATACRRLSTMAAIITTSVCNVIGTGVPGIGMCPAAVAAHNSPAVTRDGAHCSMNVRIVRREGAVISVFCISIPFVMRAGPMHATMPAVNAWRPAWKPSAATRHAAAVHTPRNLRHVWQSGGIRAPAHPGRPPQPRANPPQAYVRACGGRFVAVNKTGARSLRKTKSARTAAAAI